MPTISNVELTDKEAALIACMPHVCPSCQSAHVAYPDSKGLVECQECGDWFNPLLGAAGGPTPNYPLDTFGRSR